MPKGGYRKPGNPAPVSGPGALSRRTDGGPIQGAMEIPGNGKYGERKALQEMQSAAPMQGNPIPNTPAPSVPTLPKLFDQTQRPTEPVTSGASVGPGRTPEPTPIDGRYAMVSKYMPQLKEMARIEDVPQSFKILMQYIEAANKLDNQ